MERIAKLRCRAGRMNTLRKREEVRVTKIELMRAREREMSRLFSGAKQLKIQPPHSPAIPYQ